MNDESPVYDMTDDELKQAYINLTEEIAKGVRVADRMESGYARRATLNMLVDEENQLLEVLAEIERRKNPEE